MSLALGCGGGSSPDAGPSDVSSTDLGADVQSDMQPADVTPDATTPDVQTPDATVVDAQADVAADATPDAAKDVATDVSMDAALPDAALDASLPDVALDVALDTRDVGFSELPPADVAPDVPVDLPDVPFVDASDAAVCTPRAPAMPTSQLPLGGFGPVLTRDALGFAVLTSRARSTDPGILYFGRYGADGASRGSTVVSPLTDMGRLGGVVWDGSRYQFTYYRATDRAIVLAGLTATGSVESSPLVVSAGTVADPERAPMSMSVLTGERCVLWRARAIGTAPPVLHATLIDADDFVNDSALDASPADGYEVLGINHPTYRCLFVWSAGGAIRALGLPGGTATTLVPAATATTRTMATVAAMTAPDRYAVAWNQQGGDAPGLHTLMIDGLVRALGETRRVDALAGGATVRRLAVLPAATGYELITERTDGDTFVQRAAYADDGSASGAPVRVLNVCAPADVIAERLPVASDGSHRFGAFLDLRGASTVVTTY